MEMKSVVANAVELTRPVFEKRAQPLDLQLTGERTLVVGDAVRLTQVLCNLLVNADTFTPHDGLWRRARPGPRVGVRFRRASGQARGAGATFSGIA